MILAQSFWESVGNVIWFFLVVAIWIAFFMVLFSVLGDLFRSEDLSGVAKTIWVIVLLFLPFLGLLIYLIARGDGMTERAIQASHKQQEAAARYAQGIAASSGGGGAADEIGKAKELLDAGAISQAEYDALKAKALG